MKTPLIFTVLVSTIFIVGCRSVFRLPTIPYFSHKNIEAPDHWRARGKFSYRSETAKESGNFDWRQEGEDFKLRLYGPLGMGSVRISGNDNLVRIQSKGQDISSDQPLNLLYRITGLEIPIHSMPKWLTGRTSSLSPSNVILDQEERIQSFSERQWLLNYSNFEERGNQQIPMAVDASKDNVHLRMLVYTWETQ